MGSIAPFALSATGAPGDEGALSSIENPLSISADKQHGTVAIENFAESNTGWYELSAFRAGTDGSLASVGMVVLPNLSALRFDSTGRWLFAGPGSTSFWTQVPADKMAILDLSHQLAQSSDGALGFAATDSAVAPSGQLYAVTKGQAQASSIDNEGELQLGKTSPLLGDLQSALPPQVIADPLGRWLYVQTEPLIVDTYAIGIDGSLTHVSQSQSGWLFDSEFDPSGRYAFYGSQVYALNQQNGSLGDPKSFTKNDVTAIDLDPSGTALYTLETPAGSAVSEIYGYQFDSATGTVTPISGSPWMLDASARHQPWSLVVVKPAP